MMKTKGTVTAAAMVLIVAAASIFAMHYRSTHAVPFIGRWTRSFQLNYQPGTDVYEFSANGTGISTLDWGGDHTVHPFRWHKDGAFVNLVYPSQTDRQAWSVSEDGSTLTLQFGTDDANVYQRVGR